VSPEALRCLAGYEFPGNIRELRNLMERAALLCDGDEIRPEHLPEDCGCTSGGRLPGGLPSEIVSLTELEGRYLLWAAARFQGDKRALAGILGISERSLYRKLQELRAKPPGVAGAVA
jgi:DNA-binding NtrC family response regulator